jgi:hypothetical protein
MICAQKILRVGINIETQGGEPSGNPATAKKFAIPQVSLLCLAKIPSAENGFIL